VLFGERDARLGESCESLDPPHCARKSSRIADVHAAILDEFSGLS